MATTAIASAIAAFLGESRLRRSGAILVRGETQVLSGTEGNLGSGGGKSRKRSCFVQSCQRSPEDSVRTDVADMSYDGGPGGLAAPWVRERRQQRDETKAAGLHRRAPLGVVSHSPETLGGE